MKVIVLCSGGMDSVVALHWASREHHLLASVSFDYGSKHNPRELPLARETTRSQVDEVRAVLEGSRVGVKSSQSAEVEVRARLESKRAAAAASRADVTAAESTMRKARRDLDRMQQLMKNDYVSRREFDDATAALEVADATLEAVRRRLSSLEKEIQQTEAEVASRVLGTEQARQRVAEVRGTLARAEAQLGEMLSGGITTSWDAPGSSALNTAMVSIMTGFSSYADDNVYLVHSLRLCEALNRAGKDYEFLPLVNQTHMVADPLATVRQYMRMMQHFDRTLAPSRAAAAP